MVLSNSHGYGAQSEIPEVQFLTLNFSGSTEYGVTCSFPINDLDPNAPFKDLVWNAPADVKTVQEAFKVRYLFPYSSVPKCNGLEGL